MDIIMIVILVAIGVAVLEHFLNYLLWVWATRGGVFTALFKMIRAMIVFFIVGIFLSAPIWYWIWVYDQQIITYPTALAGIFLTGTSYSFWSIVVQPEHIIDRLRETEEDSDFFDKKNELVFFFILVIIGSAIYFQYFA